MKPILYKFSLLFLAFICFPFSLLSQIDKEFWFVGPEISSNHGDSPVYMRVSTMDDPANILLRMPANLKFAPISQLIPPNSTVSIQLDVIGGNPSWKDSIENKPPNQVLNKGLLLTSDNLITAYYDDANTSNPAIWPMKGKNALGTEFFIPGQNNYANQTNDGSEAFDIVATEDNTTITITPTLDIVGHVAGVPFVIVLNKGETYSARTMNTTAVASLKGSHVTSDKPIAITISDDSIITGGWDIIGDQLVPVNLLGNEYIVIKGFADNSPPNNDERVYVCATQNNTELRIDGNSVPVATLNAGEQYNYDIPSTSNTVYLDATKPVYVYHLSGHPGEAGASILPQDSCTGSIKIGFARSSSSAFAMLILTHNGNQGNFLLNGDNTIITAPAFNVVPGSAGEWVYFRQNNMTLAQVPVGANLLQNTSGKFHLGIINNVGASSEYGYFSDFSTLYLGADASICPGDSMVLDAGANMETYDWFKLVGGSWLLVDTTRFYTIYDSGFFSCVVNGNFCTLMDTIHISLYPNATVDLGSDTSICEGTSITFNPGSFVSYAWSTGSTLPTLTTGNGGEYWVEVINNNDCIARDTVMLAIDSLPYRPVVIYGEDTVCQGSGGWLYSVDSIPFASEYAWSFPPGATGQSDSTSILLDYSSSATSGFLAVHGHNFCGDGLDTVLFVTVKPLPGVTGTLMAPDTICQLDTPLSLSTTPIPYTTSYGWQLPPGLIITSGSGSNILSIEAPIGSSSGTIAVWGINDCGTSDTLFKELVVKLFPVPSGPITGNDTVCQGAVDIPYTVEPIDGALLHLWTVPTGATITSGDSTPTITLSWDSTALSGSLIVRGWSDCGTGDSASFPVTVNPLPSPAGPITGPDTVCQGETGLLYTITPLDHATAYNWTMPPGASITAGAGSPQITLSFSRSAESGILTVQGFNDTCGAGRISSLPLTLNPLPADANTINGPDSICQNSTGATYTLPAIEHALNYVWTYTGTGATLTNNGSTAILDFSASASSGILTAYGVNGCGDGIISPPFLVHENPCPDVSFTLFPDITTRAAQPILLRGGIPLGGSYSGTGVSNGWFTPSMVPVGTDTVTIAYTVFNQYNCYNTTTKNILIRPSLYPFSCGDTLIDVRDSIRYPTTLIGSQCWMAANLAFGIRIVNTQSQRDNFIPEKYCYGNQPEPCSPEATLYQWDEVMQYRNDAGIQGLCPPGWHLPTEAEWSVLFNQFINSGFTGNALKYNGYSGFNALLTGIGFYSLTWKYPTSDPLLRSILFWSSTTHGQHKAWAHGLNEVAADDEYTPSVSFYPAYCSNAFAVRCIRD